MLKLGLQNPVDAKTFAALLHGRGPEGEPLRPASPQSGDWVRGWRVSLAQEGPLNVLWALSPSLVRGRLQLAHNQAVREAIDDVERALNGRPWFNNTLDPHWKHTLFAKFQSGASRDWVPRLETTVFHFNFMLQRRIVLAPLTPDQASELHGRMLAVYRQALRRGVMWVLGDAVQLPKELVQRFHGESVDGDAWGGRRVNLPSRWEGRQLVAAWQEQARKWGWGPERVVRLLREAKLQPTWHNYVESWGRQAKLGTFWAHRTNHSPLGIFAAQAGINVQTTELIQARERRKEEALKRAEVEAMERAEENRKECQKNQSNEQPDGKSQDQSRDQSKERGKEKASGEAPEQRKQNTNASEVEQAKVKEETNSNNKDNGLDKGKDKAKRMTMTY